MLLRVAGALLLWLLACSPPATTQGPPASQAAPAAPAGSQPDTSAATPPGVAPSQPAPPETLRSIQVTSATLSAAMTPLWVAAEQGLFRRHGLAVELTGTAPATATQAVTAGSVPISISGGSSVTAWVSGARELVFVGGLSNKAVFRIMGRPEITRLDHLRGKAIGSSTPGSGASIALLETLRRLGMEPDRDVSITYLREQPGIVSGLLSDVVQAGVLASPFIEQAQEQGATVVVDMRELNIDLLTVNVTTTRQQIERDPDLIRRFLMGYIEGIQLAHDQPSVGVEAIMRGSQNDNRAQAQAAYTDYLSVWNPWPSEAAIRTVLDNIDLPEAKRVHPAEMIDLSFLQELERSGWLAAHYRPS